MAFSSPSSTFGTSYTPNLHYTDLTNSKLFRVVTDKLHFIRTVFIIFCLTKLSLYAYRSLGVLYSILLVVQNSFLSSFILIWCTNLEFLAQHWLSEVLHCSTNALFTRTSFQKNSQNPNICYCGLSKCRFLVLIN